MDMLGKEVMNVENCSGNTVNIANLPAGIYVVRVLSQSGKTHLTKLVKE
ncbi:MAG: T9SS type A sorting domain-containing protein [Bacteroidales bacterium]|nr:T9SS type A sorting domain-containing protein [Bacteroidales bacterium]